ncbi:hypothetical protein DP923_02605 [Pontibacter arcticus]|uniref:CcmD family protein n=2 Tax=Pontibacter arcticus TaxID=2080288 RepID=A0A364RI58_9BACT|nr:hypothetical protein DP923_02605 [Pontibacter arcticus]
MLRILALCCFILCGALGIHTTPVQAQPEQTTVEFSAAQPEVEMADQMRQDGKIYIVVTVLLTVLGGLLFYVITVDRKVSKLEKELKEGLGR